MKDNYNTSYYNAFQMCNDQGKINLLKVISEENAISIFTMCYQYTKLMDNYLMEHYNAITEELAKTHGKKFSKKLLRKIAFNASNEVLCNVMLIGKGEHFYLNPFSKELLFKLLNESTSPYIRYRAAYYYFDNIHSDAEKYFLNKGDYQAICHNGAEFYFLNLTEREIFEILFCQYITKDILNYNYYKIKKMSPKSIISAVENIESYRSFTNYNKHVMKALLNAEGVKEALTTKAADTFLKALGNDSPKEVFDKASKTTINETLRDISLNGTDKEFNSFFIRVMNKYPKLITCLSLTAVKKLRYNVIKKYDEEIIHAVANYNIHDAHCLELAINTSIDKIMENLNKGYGLYSYEILRLELK